MAITGTFLADFSNFTSAVDKAQVSLKGFEGDAHKVESSLSRMTDSFSGRKVVQEATLMTGAISKIGGVSRLSTSEAAGSLRTLEAAMDKMLRTGQEIPTTMMKTAAELRNVGRASSDADKAVLSISQNYRQFDGILQSLGINIGPYVKGMEDITSLFSNGVPAVLSFGGALAVVGAAISGWKLGEKVGELTGWTGAIAKGTAVLMGYGDVAQETAMAIADATDAAGHAERMWKLQAEGAKAAADATADQSAEARRNWTITEGNTDALNQLQASLDAVKKKREDDAKATFAQSQAQSIFRSEAHFTTEVIAEQTQALDDRLKKLAEEEAARKQATADFMNAPTLNDRVNDALSFDLPALSQTDVQRLNAQYDPFGQGGNTGILARLKVLEGKEGTYAPKSRESYLTMLSETRELAQLRMWAQTQGFAGGVENFSGGLARVHKDELLVNMAPGTSVIPAGRGGGLAIGKVTIHANSRMDGERAGRAFIAYLKSSGQLLPGGGGS